MFLKVFFKDKTFEFVEFSNEEFLKILLELDDYILDNFYSNDLESEEKIENIQIDKNGWELDIEQYFKNGYKIDENFLLKKIKKEMDYFEPIKKGSYESLLCSIKSDQKLKINWILSKIFRPKIWT